MFRVFVYLSPVECDPASQFTSVDQSKCVDIRFHCEAKHFPLHSYSSDNINNILRHGLICFPALSLVGEVKDLCMMIVGEFVTELGSS